MTPRIDAFLNDKGLGPWERLREDLREMRDQRAELLAAARTLVALAWEQEDAHDSYTVDGSEMREIQRAIKRAEAEQ